MKLKKNLIIYILVIIFITGITFAQNPIITNMFTAGPGGFGLQGYCLSIYEHHEGTINKVIQTFNGVKPVN